MRILLTALLCVDKCSPTESYQVLEYWAAVEVPENASVLAVQEFTTHNSRCFEC